MKIEKWKISVVIEYNKNNKYIIWITVFTLFYTSGLDDFCKQTEHDRLILYVYITNTEYKKNTVSFCLFRTVAFTENSAVMCHQMLLLLLLLYYCCIVRLLLHAIILAKHWYLYIYCSIYEYANCVDKFGFFFMQKNLIILFFYWKWK